MAFLQVEDLSFRYPDAERSALENISFTVGAGEFVAVCGVSGCGKSTLLSLLKRGIAPFGKMSGSIFINGINREELDERTECAEIGFVHQRPEDRIVTDKVWHELAFGLENLGLPSNVIRRRVCETAAYFGIETLFRQNTADLSGGQKQLLNLAAAAVMRPKLLLLDEPTAQLDPIAASGFTDTLRKLNAELGMTILVVEHRLEEILPIADRVLMLDDGKLAFDGSPRRFTSFFDNRKDHPMIYALPSAAEIFRALGGKGDCPLTVREGRRYVMSTFKNTVRSLPQGAAAAADCAFDAAFDPDAGAPPYSAAGAEPAFTFNAEPTPAVNAAPDPAFESVSGTPDIAFGAAHSRKAEQKNTKMSAKDIRFRYEKDSADVLKNTSLNIYEGEHLCLLGGNGAGKTTLLSVLSGILKPYGGTVRFNGKKLGSYKDRELYRRGIAVLPQDPRNIFTENTVRAEMDGMCRSMGYEKERARRLIEETAEKLGIISILDRHPYDLSGGEQQKAAIAVLLLGQPEVLFLDEPTKGIDAYGKNRLSRLMSDLKCEGMTIVTVTHDTEFAAAYSDRCAFLFDGEIVSSDTPKKFFSGNAFYTTAAGRIADGYYEGAVLADDVVKLCRLNGKKEADA